MSHHAAGHFDPLLVSFSILIAMAGAFGALDLAGAARTAPRRGGLWLAAAAGVFGASVWTMHFIAMLAYHAPAPVSYDMEFTALSALVALLFSWTGFHLAGQEALGRFTIPAAGAVTGIGVGAMHYIGMASMRIWATIDYDPRLVALSVICAIAAATLALWLAFQRLGAAQKLLGAIVLGLGVVGMHYIGMAAVEITLLGTEVGSPVAGLSRSLLAVAVALGALGVLTWMALASLLERRRAWQELAGQEARHRSVVDTAVDPILVIDERGMIVSFNPAAEGAFGYDAGEVVGRNISMLMPEPPHSAHGRHPERYRRAGERRIIGLGREGEGRRKDGGVFPLELSMGEWRAGDACFFTIVLRDVTQRRESEREQRRLREALEAEKALLHAVVDRMPSGLVVVEAPDGRLLMQNAAADRFLGHGAPAVATLADLGRYGAIDAEGRPLPAERYPLARAMREGVEIDQEEMVYRRGDGRLVTLSVSAAPVRDPQGRVALAICTFQDVSERRALEAALREGEARYRSLVESQADMVIRFDASRRLTLVNEAVCRTLGRSRETLLGACWDDLIDPGTIEATLQALQGASRDLGRRVTIENRILTAEGPRWFLWQGSAIFDEAGGAPEMQAVGRDVTERKAAEEERAAAREAAEAANLAKSKFLAAASHDLRQPLQSLFFVASALRRQVTEGGRANLDLLETGLRSLKDLLDSLLDISRIDAGAVEPSIEAVELEPLLAEIAATNRPAAEQKGLELVARAAPGLTVRTDRTLLERMLRNLTENALRYTERGEVALLAEAEGERVRIDVRDTGVGVPSDHLSRIFEEFHQVGNAGRDRSQGLGLGLAIVRRLSHLLNHPVSVVSRIGEGSIFSLHVPRAAAAASAAPDPEVPEEASRALTVLAIDDDTLVLMGLEAMLEDCGHTILSASGAEEALRVLETNGARPDIVICDYRLGGGRYGTEAVRLVRERLGDCVPAIILTGETSAAGHADIERSGSGVAHKPITPRLLQQAIKRQLTAATLPRGRTAA